MFTWIWTPIGCELKGIRPFTKVQDAPADSFFFFNVGQALIPHNNLKHQVLQYSFYK